MAPPDVTGTTEVEVGPDELAALALAADPEQPLGDDAVPFRADGEEFPELLPAWYMPVPESRIPRRGTRAVIGLVIAAFAVINGLGLCITYGYLTIA